MAMTVPGVELKVSEATVARSGEAGDRDVLLFVCKAPPAGAARESEGIKAGAGATTFIYHGVKMRMTAIKAKAKRVFRSIYF